MNENEALTLLKKILDMTNRNALEWNADVTAVSYTHLTLPTIYSV